MGGEKRYKGGKERARGEKREMTRLAALTDDRQFERIWSPPFSSLLVLTNNDRKPHLDIKSSGFSISKRIPKCELLESLHSNLELNGAPPYLLIKESMSSYITLATL